MRRTAVRFPSAALACALLLTACWAVPGSTTSGSAPGGHDTVTLDVFVAASLAGPVGELAADFQAQHDGVRVRVSSGGSSDLVAQVLAGAPADVLVTADEHTMSRLTGDPQSPAVGTPVAIATNTPALVVPADNPAGITSLAGAAGSRLVICAPQVPCGDSALRLADAAGVTLRPVSEEASVTDVVAKVTSGEADAGIVYATDAHRGVSAGTLRELPVPESAQIVNRALGVVLGADAPGGASGGASGDAASDAAWDAAGVAHRAAAGVTARDGASDAARGAGRDASRDGAGVAHGYTARVIASDGVRDVAQIAREFLAALTGESGQALLREAGFGAP